MSMSPPWYWAFRYCATASLSCPSTAPPCSCPTAPNTNWFQRGPRSLNKIQPDSRPDVPSTTVAYRRWSHSRFARHRALQRVVLVAHPHRAVRAVHGEPQGNDERSDARDREHQTVADRQQRSQPASRHSRNGPRHQQLGTSCYDAGAPPSPLACDQPHKYDRPQETHHDVDHQSHDDESRRTTRNRSMSKRRADGGEGQPDAPQ